MLRRLHELVAVAALLALPTVSQADAYGDARTKLLNAYQQNDYPAMRIAADEALAARPGYPGALFNRALAEVLDEDHGAAFATLGKLLDMGIHFGIDGIGQFAPLQSSSQWNEYESKVAELDMPKGTAEIVARLDIADFIPEGIAVDKNGEIFLGSIRHGTIFALGESARILDDNADRSHWSVFGMRSGGEALWFASAAVPQYLHVTEENSGRTGLFQLSITTGELVRAAPLPPNGREQVLGDLVIADDVIYTTDSASGELYRYSIAANTYTAVTERGVFGSPQGLVLDERGEHLYVADYIGGIYRVRLLDGRVEKVTSGPAISDFGIDGLYRYKNELIAIQNGIQPHRVVTFELARDGLSIVGSRLLASNLPEFDEPTLGTIVGDQLFFVANSHWNRFDQDNNLPDKLVGPVILSVAIDGGSDETRHGNRMP
jgi:sugar lactone lactonase YvrE